ncbi:MAG: ABC transporter permease subunit, partial [Myxococcota bacterium]
MNQIWSIAVKELRGYFNSAVALIFLATFLAVVLFTFFWVDKFFARGLADVRPLFDWLPILLIFLVSALTMRLWSEEQKTGTLELLLTLPVPVHRLVMGKFLAGFILVAIALALTLGLPLTVDRLGELDWGPVFGGYLAALLLAGTYLAVGLCVSSTTDNQIVALIASTAVCFALYLPGTDQVASLFGLDAAEVLRQVGTGSRFESVARGVLDIRDLAYYASLIVFFLALNTALLMAKSWGTGERMQPVRTSVVVSVLLIALNAVALNVWLTPVTAIRADLTKGGQYSLSDATVELLESIDEPLVIRGYFSETTHPLLAPLVPQILGQEVADLRDQRGEQRMGGLGEVAA